MKSIHLIFCISLFNLFHCSLWSAQINPPHESSESEEELLEEIVIYYFLYNLEPDMPFESVRDSLINLVQKDFPAERKYLLQHAKPILEEFNIKTINDFANKKSIILFHIVKHILNQTCTTNFRDDFAKYYIQKKAISVINQSHENNKDKANILIRRLESGSPYSEGDVLIWSKIIATLESYMELPEVVEALARALASRVESIRKEARQVLRKNPSTSDMLQLYDYCTEKINSQRMIQQMVQLEPGIRKIILANIFNSFKGNTSKINSEDLALFHHFDQDAFSDLLVELYKTRQYNLVISRADIITKLKQLEKYEELASLLSLASQRGDDEFLKQFFITISVSEAKEHHDALASALPSVLEKTASLKVFRAAFSLLQSLENSVYLAFGITAALSNTNAPVHAWLMKEILNTQLPTESKLVLDIILALFKYMNEEDRDYNLAYEALVHIINHSEQLKKDLKEYKQSYKSNFSPYIPVTFNDVAYFLINQVKFVFYNLDTLFNNSDLLRKNIEIIKSLNIENHCYLFEHIVDALKTDDYNIRIQAINALKILSQEEKYKETIQIVRDALKEEKDEAVRVELQKYLQELGGNSWCIIS